MPEVMRTRGYRFFFFSQEGNEPRHIHVERAGNYAKFWLSSIAVAKPRGFRGHELREVHKLIEESRSAFILSWDAHFGQ